MRTAVGDRGSVPIIKTLGLPNLTQETARQPLWEKRAHSVQAVPQRAHDVLRHEARRDIEVLRYLGVGEAFDPTEQQSGASRERKSVEGALQPGVILARDDDALGRRRRVGELLLDLLDPYGHAAPLALADGIDGKVADDALREESGLKGVLASCVALEIAHEGVLHDVVGSVSIPEPAIGAGGSSRW